MQTSTSTSQCSGLWSLCVCILKLSSLISCDLVSCSMQNYQLPDGKIHEREVESRMSTGQMATQGEKKQVSL